MVTTDVDVQTPQDVINDARRYVLLGKRSYFYLGGGAWNIQVMPQLRVRARAWNIQAMPQFGGTDI